MNFVKTEKDLKPQSFTRNFTFTHISKRPIKRQFQFSRNPVLAYDTDFKKYLIEIEEITSLPISKRQREFLKAELENGCYMKLSPDESRIHRQAFGKLRCELIADWETNRGMKWPTYDENVYNKHDKIIRKVGGKYDAHEIIENSWGSPHHWWNLHPASHPDQHQKQIHGKGSMAAKIFGH